MQHEAALRAMKRCWRSMSVKILQNPILIMQAASDACASYGAAVLHIVERSETMLHAERQLRCAPRR